MGATPPDDVTQMLTCAAHGEESAVAKLLPLVYDNLRALAGSYLLNERGDHTLQPTALVHEAYMKLLGGEKSDWKDRAHFFAIAAGAMRQILADHARRKKAAKRGGGQHRVTLSGLKTPATTEMADLYPEQARIVEMRFLAGLTVDEVAHVLSVSKSTVERKWRMARAWLRRQLSGDTPV